MALRISASAAAVMMVGLALAGNVLKGAQVGDRGAAPTTAPVVGPVSEPARPAEADKASPEGVTAAEAPSPAVAAAEGRPAAGVAAASDAVDTSPTGSIDPGSGLHRPNPAAYGDAAKQGSSFIVTGAEAVNYLAGNTLKWQAPGGTPHFTYFASRGVMADGTERDFIARAWDRNRADLCLPGQDGMPACRPLQILLDAKQELEGGRLGTATIGTDLTAELVKGNVLRVPPHIPFLDSVVALDTPASSSEAGRAGLAGLVDHAAAVTTESGADRRFVYYGADNKLLDVQPVEAGADGGHAVKVSVRHWRLTKAAFCETGSAGASADACFKPQPLADGAVRLVPVAKGGQALRVMALPETSARAVAED